ncbi:MAG TPA: hypothetical protein VGS41_17500, partial [Chthonomonadales bacterium]|nr:hypothetical protein [Chthonomonadales bacterium]
MSVMPVGNLAGGLSIGPVCVGPCADRNVYSDMGYGPTRLKEDRKRYCFCPCFMWDCTCDVSRCFCSCCSCVWCPIGNPALPGVSPPAPPGPGAPHSQLVHLVTAVTPPNDNSVSGLAIYCVQSGVTLLAACDTVTFYHPDTTTKTYQQRAGTGTTCYNGAQSSYTAHTGAGAPPTEV